MPPIEAFPPESLGQRIGALRAQHGWTQADLAGKIAASRVAISHFEMGLAIPSERTVVLLAGLFKLTPLDLVVGTDYPAAKRERLPLTAPLYTEVELQLALLDRDLAWLESLDGVEERKRMATELADQWGQRFVSLEDGALDPVERALIRAAATSLQRAVTEELAVPSTR
jgi:transcriptional regulator with XRE-family HTH domain